VEANSQNGQHCGIYYYFLLGFQHLFSISQTFIALRLASKPISRNPNKYGARSNNSSGGGGGGEGSEMD